MAGVPWVRMAEPAPDNNAQAIPNKLYFRIGEVSQIVGVPQYVLRFWETEFTGISPKKSGRGHRLYRRKDVELLLEVKRLLYEKRFTIEGARNYLKQQAKAAGRKASVRLTQGVLFPASSPVLEQIRDELRAILGILN